jgi:hypothetical protein
LESSAQLSSNPETYMSLKDQIKQATSIKEIEDLLKKGGKFQFASDDTRRKWVRTAQKRAAELES